MTLLLLCVSDAGLRDDAVLFWRSHGMPMASGALPWMVFPPVTKRARRANTTIVPASWLSAGFTISWPVRYLVA